MFVKMLNALGLYTRDQVDKIREYVAKCLCAKNCTDDFVLVNKKELESDINVLIDRIDEILHNKTTAKVQIKKIASCLNESLFDEYVAGVSVNELSNKYGISDSAIYARLRKISKKLGQEEEYEAEKARRRSIAAKRNLVKNKKQGE